MLVLVQISSQVVISVYLNSESNFEYLQQALSVVSFSILKFYSHDFLAKLVAEQDFLRTGKFWCLNGNALINFTTDVNRKYSLRQNSLFWKNKRNSKFRICICWVV
jgi:hypothetical protein